MWKDAIHPLMECSLTFIFLSDSCPWRERLISSRWCCLFCSGVSLTWKGILHAYHHDMHLLKTAIYIQGFYFIVAFLCTTAWFFIKWCTPLWRRLCTYLHQHFVSGISKSGKMLSYRISFFWFWLGAYHGALNVCFFLGLVFLVIVFCVLVGGLPWGPIVFCFGWGSTMRP